MHSLLEDITLVTCGTHCNGSGADSTIDLSKFHNLRRISWFGADNYTEALHVVLKTNSRHLTDLQLEYQSIPTEDLEDDDSSYDEIDYSEDEDEATEARGEYLRNFFAREVLDLKPSTPTSELIFPALTSLSLSFISLKNARKISCAWS
jgi:hypothetical protein